MVPRINSEILLQDTIINATEINVSFEIADILKLEPTHTYSNPPRSVQVLRFIFNLTLPFLWAK